MRKRRVIIFTEDQHTRNSLTSFFDARGYESLVFRDAAICPVYGEGKECHGPHTCGDIIIMSDAMKAMDGLDLLVAQNKRGCRLPAENKAIIGGSLPDEGKAILALLGSALFQSPLDLGKLEQWVSEREAAMDLDRPVAVRRREERQAGQNEILSVFLAGDVIDRVTVVNKSNCGICFRTSHRLLPNQIITFRTDAQALQEDGLIRWVKRAGEDAFLVGLSCCL